MSNMRRREVAVLLVDDDARLSGLVGDWLESRGYCVDFAACGKEALTLADHEHFDAIVLDLDMPGTGGLAVCRALRETSNPTTPIIFLTARNTVESKVEGLAAGADDYLVKPFSPQELSARIEALVRRSRNEVAPEAFEIDDVRADPWSGFVTRAGKHLHIKDTGMAILVELMRAHPRVVTRDEMLKKIWGARTPESDALRSHLYQLRKTLNSGFEEELIATIPGVGYRFRAPRACDPILSELPKGGVLDDASAIAD
jgi:DNA-binding response OmpR family regulator